jgi:hypothetical protein
VVVVGDGASATTIAAISSFRFQLLSMLLRLLLTLSCFSCIPSHEILRKGIIVAGGRYLIRAFVNCSFRAAMQLAAVFFALALALVLSFRHLPPNVVCVLAASNEAFT